jgi:SAM-dependent methyltransferase
MSYRTRNYFGYREWLYEPYLKALLAWASVRTGSTLLDVGCGQGFFSNLFRKCGMRVTGVDRSETGIRMARECYGSSDIEFLVADISTSSIGRTFDCVFTRSLSLYNTPDFATRREVTEALMRYVRPSGTFIFAYNTNLNTSKANSDWRYHSLGDARRHFSNYEGAKCFFTVKTEAIIFGKYAFNALFSTVGATVSRALGVGGDLVCIARRE